MTTGLNVVTWNGAEFDKNHQGLPDDFFKEFKDYDLFLVAEDPIKKPPDSIGTVKLYEPKCADGVGIYYAKDKLKPVGSAIYKKLDGGSKDLYTKNYSGRAVAQLFSVKNDSSANVFVICVHAGHYWNSQTAKKNPTNLKGEDRIDKEAIVKALSQLKSIQYDNLEDKKYLKIIVGGDFNEIGKLGSKFCCGSKDYSPIGYGFTKGNVCRNSTTEKKTLYGTTSDRIFAAGSGVKSGDRGDVGGKFGSDHHCVYMEDI